MNSRVYPTYKTKYHVANWPSYDRALIGRGDVTLWVSPEAIASWEPAGVRTERAPLELQHKIRWCFLRMPQQPQVRSWNRFQRIINQNDCQLGCQRSLGAKASHRIRKCSRKTGAGARLEPRTC